MKARYVALPLFLAVCCAPGRAQTAQKANPDVQPPRSGLNGQRNSGPLAWTVSDFNPKTVFWIQGRFVPVGDSNHQGEAEVVTILCSLREYECLEFDSASPFVHSEQVWIEDFKPVNWDNDAILATARSLDGCTDETLKIRFTPPSVVLINSPVLPMSANCKKVNSSWDQLLQKKGSGIAAQMEQDELVPTRGLVPFQDMDSEAGKAAASAPQTNP